MEWRLVKLLSENGTTWRERAKWGVFSRNRASREERRGRELVSLLYLPPSGNWATLPSSSVKGAGEIQGHESTLSQGAVASLGLKALLYCNCHYSHDYFVCYVTSYYKRRLWEGLCPAMDSERADDDDDMYIILMCSSTGHGVHLKWIWEEIFYFVL